MQLAELPGATSDSPPATAERIADVLRQRMVEGVLPPGTPVREATVAAQLATDEAFQPPWVPRDRLIFELLRTGRRAEARNELRAYLEDSERAVLDLLRGSYSGGNHPGEVDSS